MDYFTLFDLPKKFKVDEKLLAEKFYLLQSKFHPDVFINDINAKKNILQKSIEINKGYKTLKDFLSRAIYLLLLNGFKVKTENMLLHKNRFLIEYFSLYEEIDAFKKNNCNQKNWDNIIQKVENKIVNCQKSIELEFEKKNYIQIILIIEKLLFLKKIKYNLKKEQNLFLRQEN